MRALVLGGCGFIGSHVVDSLVQAGLKVRVFDRAPERFRPPLAGVEYIYADFQKNTSVLEALTDVDVVMHLVSATVPGTAALDPQADVRDNLVPTISLLEAMRKSKVNKLIYLSSGGTVYGIPETVPTKETEPLRPINSYGIVKVAIENYIQLYAREHDVSATILRPSNPYGPRQGHTGLQGVVGTFLQRALSNEPIQIWGDGRVIRDFLYVEDLADLCRRCATSPASGIFNAGYGEGLTVNEVIEQIFTATGKKLEVAYAEGRKLDVPVSVLDITAAKQAYGWVPRTDISSGIMLHWNWLRSI
jgi:UDP-glucose 4-epimerase